MKDYMDATVQWKWRSYFTKANLDLGQSDMNNNKLEGFECDPNGAWAKARTIGGFDVEVKRAPTSFEEALSYPSWNTLTSYSYGYQPSASSRYYSCSCSSGKNGQRCRHLASLLLKWEKEHGPFVFTEDEEAHAKRIETIRQRQALEQRQKQLEQEKKQKQANVFPVLDYVLDRYGHAPKGLFFPIDNILKKTELYTDAYETGLLQTLLSPERVGDVNVETLYGETRSQVLRISGSFAAAPVTIRADRSSIIELSCGCSRSHLRYSGYYWRSTDNYRSRMCAHALAAWVLARQKIIRDNPGDETDYKGSRFLALISGENRPGPAADSAKDVPVYEKQPRVVLTPRITRDKARGKMTLNFDIGRTGERCYAVKGLKGLVEAVEGDQTYGLSKASSLDFSRETFTPDSARWYALALSRVRAIGSVNARIHSYAYGSVTLSAGAGIPLEESDLDVVYDMAQGGDIQYQYGSRAETCAVPVREASPRVEMRIAPIRSGDRLTGVTIKGNMPRLLRGSQHRYILDRSCFGRVADDGDTFVSTLQDIADGTGAFSCAIGLRKLAEFYYRVLPVLQNSPQITIVDDVGSQIDAYLPPEPRFTFYLDLDGETITCDPHVAYGDRAFRLGEAPADTSVQRDADQELRVLAVVQGYFPMGGAVPSCPGDDDHLAWILTDGVAALSAYGDVQGSDRFKRVHIAPLSQPRFSVELEGGLLDLSIKTRDMTEDELIELLASYRLKKRWHRLRSGDFVDLRQASALDELTDTAQAMDIAIEDLIHGGVKVPKYRALYVDRLLEAHDDIAHSRSRLFKALVRAFQDIRNSDFEVSETLRDALRPYQLYGFRWLSTLAQAGFGGILADEMGLGKTVQMLAFIQAQRLGGEGRPALVVCPSSLVYNWKDECRKFTPDLNAATVAGTLTQRRALLNSPNVDVFITSYDLLKRDITLYDGITFSTIVLDEAQYIKNQKAAVSKAVRVLKGEHRFALTGTPIENRLSELWSIFDFLMPGFLYTAPEFAARFEGPIMKQKDARVTEKLAAMTAPFILRRKKADVLRDLPDKLEETRSTELAEDQRKLYDAQLARMKALLNTSGDTGEDKMRILAEITRLRQLCCDPSLLLDDYHGTSAKRAACIELIQSAMDAGHRMLVFSQFTSMLSLLQADLRAAKIPFFTLTGSTPKQERLRLVNAFNDGDTPVFLISLKAGGTGLNLTGADVVIHYDPWWNLAVQNQATDRAHRIGQARQVTVIKLIAADTIEEKIVQLQQTKKELADAIISGQNTSLMSLSKEELLALLE